MFLFKEITSGNLVFGLEPGILLGLSVTMNVLVPSFPEVDKPFQGRLHD